MSGALLYEVRDRIGFVTFNRPDARNALTFDMYEALAEICRTAGNEGEVGALVLAGAGDKAFAAGTDIAQFRAFATPKDAIDYEHRIDSVLEAIERCRVPTVAALVGACTGGGAGIAAACDIRIASRDLKFGYPIARTLGNCLSARNLARLAALIGSGRTREIIFTSRFIGADEALTMGLITEVLEGADDVKARAEELAHQLAGQAPLTIRATKEALRRLAVAAADVEDEDLIVSCYMSEDFREGLEAFLAKRAPLWKGR